MARANSFLPVCLLLWAALCPLRGQQSRDPALPAGAGDNQSQQPAPSDLPQPATTTAPSAPAAINPATGLPYTPAELREKEIDKYDPLKPAVDPTVPDPIRLTDRGQPAAPDANPGNSELPLPGSVAASNAVRTVSSGDASGNLSADASASGSDYNGPAVLTRSYTLARPMDSQQIKWKVTLGLNWGWDVGQVPGESSSNGVYPSEVSQSRSPTWSLSGRHIWKFDQLGITYTGNYSDYTATRLSGLNNSLNLDYTHVVSRRLAFHFVESLQLLSQNYSLENPVLEPGSSVANINLATSPYVQILDSTVRQSNSTASMTYHPSTRLSYEVSGSYFAIGRTGVGLVGTVGYQAMADVNYRWTRRATVGAYYSFTNYQFSHNMADSDSNGAGLIYSYALDRRTQLRTRAGAARISTRSYETVALPAELAAILGQGSTTVNAHTLSLISDVSAELVRDFGRNHSASVAFARGESPGNGVQLTSTQETITGGYSARVGKRVSANVNASYYSLDSLAQSGLGFYKGETAGFALTREIRRGVESTIRVDYRRYDISNSPLLQHDLRFTFGISWNPRENSLRF